MTTLWNCGPLMDWLGEDMDEDVDEPQEFNPEKGKYYLFENEYPSDYEWDWQIFKDDTLMSVKDDTLRKQILCRVGLADDDKDCIILKVDYDGNLINYGNLDTLYSVTYYDDKIAFYRVDCNEIILKEFYANKQNISITHSQKASRAIDWIKNFENALDIKDIYYGGKAISEGKLKKFAKDATINVATKPLPQPIGIAFSASEFILIDPLIEAHNSKIRTFLYGNNVTVEISSINETSPGNLSINIVVSGINTIPQKIKLNPINDLEACIPNSYYKNHISLAVVCRKDFIPYTNEYDYSTYEVPINLDGQNEQTFTLTLPRLKGGEYYLRPYIRSHHDVVFKNDIHPERVIYGTSYNYRISSINILGINPKKLVYDYTSQELFCSYSVEVEKNIGDMPGKIVSGYGIYEYVDENKKIYPLVNEGSNTKGYVQISENPMGVEYDYKSYTGSIEKRFGAYIATINDSYSAVHDTIFFYDNNYTLIFQLEEPTIEIKSVKLIETKGVYSTYGYDEVAVPAIGKESHFQVHVVSKCMPFGHESWMAGGEFYTIRGGTSTHPTPARLDVQNIAATIKEESKDNINFYYEVYVTKYHTDDNIGENPLYFGFESQFTETDSIVSKNYVKFNYVPNSLLDVDGGYKTAEIITGKMPDYVPKTIYSKEQ